MNIHINNCARGIAHVESHTLLTFLPHVLLVTLIGEASSDLALTSDELVTILWSETTQQSFKLEHGVK